MKNQNESPSIDVVGKLIIPPELLGEIRQIAQANNVSEVQVLRQFIKLGLLAASGTPIYVKTGDEFHEIDLFDLAKE